MCNKNFFSLISEKVEFDIRSYGICGDDKKGSCPGGGVCCENVKKLLPPALIEYKCVEANNCLDIP